MKLLKSLILFLIGGLIYMFIEIAFRGYSHWTMFILGGICFLFLDGINNYISWNIPLWLQSLIGAIVITTLEFITGCIVNLWLGWNIWNYSDLSLNFLGQICLWFFFLWYLLSPVGIVLGDYLRYFIFHEEKPHYTLFKWGKNNIY